MNLAEARERQDRMIRTVLRWDDCMVEMDGQMEYCGEHFQAMQTAIDNFRGLLTQLDLPTTEPLQ